MELFVFNYSYVFYSQSTTGKRQVSIHPFIQASFLSTSYSILQLHERGLKHISFNPGLLLPSQASLDLWCWEDSYFSLSHAHSYTCSYIHAHHSCCFISGAGLNTLGQRHVQPQLQIDRLSAPVAPASFSPSTQHVFILSYCSYCHLFHNKKSREERNSRDLLGRNKKRQFVQPLACWYFHSTGDSFGETAVKILLGPGTNLTSKTIQILKNLLNICFYILVLKVILHWNKKGTKINKGGQFLVFIIPSSFNKKTKTNN